MRISASRKEVMNVRASKASQVVDALMNARIAWQEAAEDGRITEPEYRRVDAHIREATLSAQEAELNLRQGIEVQRRGLEAMMSEWHIRMRNELARTVAAGRAN